MRRILRYVTAAFVAVAMIGCQSHSNEGNVKHSDAEQTEATSEIPKDLLTEGARALGAPWQSERHYKMTITGPRTETAFIVRRAELKKEDGAVRVTFTTIGGPLQGNTDTYELRPDGVWAIKFNQSPCSPEFKTVPAEMKPGYSWSYKTTIRGNEEIVLDVKATIVGKTEITVQLGTFTAWKVVTTGSSTPSNGVKQALKDVIYYVDGIGMVKDEMTFTRKDSSGTVSTTIVLEAVPEP